MIPSFVYLIRCGETDYYKIGVSDNPVERLANLQSANPIELHLIATCGFDSKLAAIRAEQDSHRNLAKYNVRGEWFEFKPKTVSQLIHDMLVAN